MKSDKESEALAAQRFVKNEVIEVADMVEELRE